MSAITSSTPAKEHRIDADGWIPEIITLLIWVAIFWGSA